VSDDQNVDTVRVRDQGGYRHQMTDIHVRVPKNRFQEHVIRRRIYQKRYKIET